MSSSIILLLPPHLPSNCIWLNKFMFSIWQRNTFFSYIVTLYQSDIFLTGLSEKYGINYYAIQEQKSESNKSISNEQYKIVFMESEMKLTLVIFSPKDLRHTSVSKMIWSNRVKSREELLGFLMPKEKKKKTCRKARFKLPGSVLICFDSLETPVIRHSVPYLGITSSPCHTRIHVFFN